MKRIVICLTLLVTVAMVAEAATTVDTNVVRVALFKNGLAFFIRQAELPVRPGEVEIGPVPVASHGSLWVGWGAGVEFANLSARQVEVAEGREALTIPELLRANVGKRVKLEFASESLTPLQGVVKAFPQRPTAPHPNPYMADITGPSDVPPPQVVLIETARGVVAISPATVSRVEFVDPPTTTVSDQCKRTALSGELVKTVPGQALSVSYLAKGMTWAPSYLVDISDPAEATLTAKATILNEIEDIEGAYVDLITGFPYLEFAEIISPLAKREDLAAFLNALGAGQSAGRRRAEYSAVTAQAMANVLYTEREPGPVPDYGAAAQGAVAEDLFYYPVEKVTLARGAVGYYPLFTEKVKYQHVYAWDIPDYLDVYRWYRNRNEEEAPTQIVWHSLRLQNSTGMPWTTAPAESVQENRILGQAVLKYTPGGGEAMVKITQALGIKADQIELEVSNEPNAYRYRGDQYDRVTIEGTLHLRSHMQKEVTVEVTKQVTGTLKSATPEPEVEKLARPVTWNWWWHINPHSRLTWQVPLKPGEEVTVTYTYAALVRH